MTSGRRWRLTLSGAPAKLAVMPPRPQWAERRRTAMRPLHAAAEKMPREGLGDQAALSNIRPRYPRIHGESWAQIWWRETTAPHAWFAALVCTSFYAIRSWTRWRWARASSSTSPPCRGRRRDSKTVMGRDLTGKGGGTRRRHPHCKGGSGSGRRSAERRRLGARRPS